jgi:cytochrome c553
MMKKLIWLLAFACLPTIAIAQNAGPDWAYPATPQGGPPRDASKILKVPGSDKEYNEVSANDAFGPADWFPNEHAPMPGVVATGKKPDVRACSLCHLTTGDGHPESANIAGLSAAYIQRSLREFAGARRKNNRSPVMATIAKGMTPDEMREAAEYFAARKPAAGYMKVVEAAEVPKTFVGEGAMRFVSPGNEKEPIGSRIIVVPQDEEAPRPATRIPGSWLMCRPAASPRASNWPAAATARPCLAPSATAKASRAWARCRRSQAAIRCTSRASSWTSRAAAAPAPGSR